MERKGTKREPKGANREPKGAKREPKGAKRSLQGDGSARECGGPAEGAVAVLDYSSHIFCYIIGYIGYIRHKRLKKQATNS